MNKKPVVSVLAIACVLASSFVGCSPTTQQPPPSSGVRAPTVSGPEIDPSTLAAGESRDVTLPNGARVRLFKAGKSLFFEAEATLSDSSYAEVSAAAKTRDEKTQLVSQRINQFAAQLRTLGSEVTYRSDSVGYLTFFTPYHHSNLLGRIAALTPAAEFLVNPVHVDTESLDSLRKLSAEIAREATPTPDPRQGTEFFSGLNMMGVTDFVQTAESEIGGGKKVDGSAVRLGITDTGITLNHPVFHSRLAGNQGTTRITYMKDFTREGRIYFHPEGVVAVTEETDTTKLSLKGKVIYTPKLPSLPAADTETQLSVVIRVNPELRAALTDPARSVNFRLGLLREEVFQSEEDVADLNANGKLDDTFPVLLSMGATPADDQIYVDFSSTGDFRNIAPLRDWNRTKDTVALRQEKVGFQIEPSLLPNEKKEEPTLVRSASIIGYDPGNHGTHVAGIAAGLQTIANDSAQTLARGVAPEAQILMDRVCSNAAGCTAAAAMVDLATEGQADVINMSLGGLSPFNDGFGVQETIVNRLTVERNTLFVISAGNSGPGKQTVGSPSVARLSLSVGAAASAALIQRQYQYPGFGGSEGSSLTDPFMLFFSSRGPTAGGGFKPNLAAPGTELSPIQLNGANGTLPGLEVYWGTSMAAPSATGAYALLLDAIKKYNFQHPEEAPLSTKTDVLRRILIESAQPFDVNRFEPETGVTTSGQYTWIDEGTGMISLPRAWALLKKFRDEHPDSLVKASDGTPVELDYDILVSSKRVPSRVSLDGSRLTTQREPIFGSGVYLDFHNNESLRKVSVARKLPSGSAVGPDAAHLEAQLLTTADTFQLKTVIYGSTIPWLRAGVLDQVDCMNSPEAPLTILGHGATVKLKEDQKGELVVGRHSQLNLCVDREAVETALPAGDHGALVYAYRVIGEQISPVASFVVPVYISVPHRNMQNSQGFASTGTVNSFGVKRHYIYVPEGTSVLKLKLEVPVANTVTGSHRLAPGEHCSGVELMALEGANTAAAVRGRPAARISNCSDLGVPNEEPSKRTLTLVRQNPRPGMWDIHVFGQYAYALSDYTLSVDYVRASTSIPVIMGDESALNGSLKWTVSETSLHSGPSSDKSLYELRGLQGVTYPTVKQDETLVVESALGTLRAYPEGVTSVTLSTGGSSGNDIDLRVFACAKDATTFDPNLCEVVGESGGSSDVEEVTLVPKPEHKYAVIVQGFDVSQHDGKFTSTERLSFRVERGTVIVTGQEPLYEVAYSFGETARSASKLLTHELFQSAKMSIFGSLELRSIDGTILGGVPVSIQRSASAGR